MRCKKLVETLDKDAVQKKINKISIILCVLMCSFITYTENSRANTTYEENIRKQIFEAPLLPSCRLINAHPTGIIKINSLFDQFILKLVSAFNKQDLNEIAKIFHPRLGMKEHQIAEIFAKMKNTYGQKFEISTFRLWALNTIDGNPIELKCSDPEIAINALYGYGLQFVLWLQIMGTEELGRIYLPIVFSAGQWRLGGLHVHQWTHDQKNYLDWSNQGKKSQQMGQDIIAFIEYDLATKLGNGDRFFSLSDMASIEQKKTAIMTAKDFEARIKGLFEIQNIVYVSPLFVKKGAGILLRFRVNKEISLIEMKESCQKTKATFAKSPWSKKLAAIRCSFVLPKEDPEKEGAMGGILIDL